MDGLRAETLREARKLTLRASDNFRMTDPKDLPRSYPFAEEDAIIARQGFLRANLTPKTAILVGKLAILGQTVLLFIMVFLFLKQQAALGKIPVFVVRINDVGRAEAIRLDTDYIPQEPELRDALERFVTRYYTRNGFAVPEAIEALPPYLDAALFDVWRKEMMAALPEIGSGVGLLRVRVLNCRIENPAQSRTIGTTAYIRIATDDMSNTGALVPGTAKGYEVVLKFKTSVYPNIKEANLKDQWVVRNPLGVKVLDITRTRYIGADVDDQGTERVVRGAITKVENEAAVEDSSRKINAATRAYQEKFK